MGKKRKVIFDLDNTLINTDRRFFSVLRLLMKQIENKICTPICQQAEQLLQQKPWLNMRDVFNDIFPPDFPRRQQVIDDYIKQYYAMGITTKIIPLPFVQQVLSFLKKQQYLLYLVSFGEQAIQQQKIESIGATYFDKIIITQTGKREIFQTIQEEDKPETYVVGDRKEDEIAAGNAVGFTTVHFCFGRHSRKPIQREIEKPLYTVYNMHELLSFFKTRT